MGRPFSALEAGLAVLVTATGSVLVAFAAVEKAIAAMLKDDAGVVMAFAVMQMAITVLSAVIVAV